MPRKGAATAAPNPPAPPPEEPTSLPEEGADDVVHAQAEEPEKPKRGSGRRRGGTAEEPPPPDDKAIEDWTKPAYADDPGEFMFDSMEDADEHYRVLWFGIEGTGKTTDVAMVTRIVPEGRILMINAEAGAKRSALAHHGVDTGRIALFPPKGQQLTFEALERLFYRVQADLEADPKSWGAVVWDSITAIYQKLLDDVIEADIKKTAEILQRANKGRGGRAGNLTMRDRFDTDRDDFAAMSNQVRLLLRKYRSLHCHLLITALERRDEDKKKNVTIGPAVSPALSTDLLGYMDAVIHTKVNDLGVFFGRTQPTEDARGKDRLNALPVELVDPTIERIHRYVSGELTEDTDRAQRRLPDREIITRRSLADAYGDTDEYGPVVGEVRYDDQGRELQWSGSDWVMTAGEDDDPEPPKRGGRSRSGRAASSGRSTATAKPNATDKPADSGPESGATEPEAAAEPPKGRATGRRSRGASSTPAADASPPPDASAPAEEPKASGRKSPAARRNSAARSQVKAETEGTDKGPATRAASRRSTAKKAEEEMKSEGYDEPPF